MWLNDPDINVKRAALTAWAGYYDKTKDSMVLKNLYNIIKHDKYDVTIRVWALYSFMYVADAFDCPREKSEIFDLDELEDNKQLNKAIYWGKINRIMGQYVPGWPKQYG